MIVNKTNNFASSLKKYYSRQKNKIIFRNKMSLNKLALKMWERLNYQGIDTSVLSRVINGQRLFTFKQLEVFCEILRITSQEYRQLKESLLLDIYNRYHLDFQYYEFDFLDSLINKTYQLRMNGKIDLAVDLTNFLLNEFKKKIDRESLFSKKNLYLSYYSKFLIENYYNNSVLYTGNQLDRHQQILITQAKNLGQQTKNKELNSLADFFSGGLLYDKGEYAKALPRLELSLKVIKIPKIKIEAMREQILSLANLNLIERFKNIPFPDKLVANKEIDLSEIASFKDGWVRAKILFKLPTALKELEETEKFYQVHKISDRYRLIQLKRSRLQLIKNFFPSDKNLFERTGKELLRLTKIYGYKRYHQIIKKLMEKTL